MSARASSAVIVHGAGQKPHFSANVVIGKITRRLRRDLIDLCQFHGIQKRGSEGACVFRLNLVVRLQARQRFNGAGHRIVVVQEVSLTQVSGKVGVGCHVPGLLPRNQGGALAIQGHQGGFERFVIGHGLNATARPSAGVFVTGPSHHGLDLLGVRKQERRQFGPAIEHIGHRGGSYQRTSIDQK